MTTKAIKTQAPQQAIELVKLSDKAAAFFGGSHLTSDIFFESLRILDGQAAAADVKRASLENEFHGFICLVRQAKAENNAGALDKLINFGKNHIGKLGSKYSSESLTFNEKTLSIVKRDQKAVAAFRARQAIDAIMPKLLSLATTAKAEAELKQLEKMPQKGEADAIAKKEALELFAAQCAVKINESKKAAADKAAADKAAAEAEKAKATKAKAEAEKAKAEKAKAEAAKAAEADKAKAAKAAEVSAKAAAEAAKKEADKAKEKAAAEVAAAKAEAAKLAEQLAAAEAKAEADLLAANNEMQERITRERNQASNKIDSLEFGKSTEAKVASEIARLEPKWSEAELVALALELLKRHSGDKIAGVVYEALESLQTEQKAKKRA